MSIRCLACLILVILLGACASADRQFVRNMQGIGLDRPDDDGHTLFRRIGNEPSNARLHFDNGRYLLTRGRHADIEMARVAFANASRLAPDWWAPEVGLAVTEYRLGRHLDALSALAEAVERRGRCDELCYSLALVAFRAGQFGLAANALHSAQRAGPPQTAAARSADEFLSAALADAPGAQSTAALRERLQRSQAADGEQTGNVAIDAYVIRQSRSSSSAQGINLLEALRLQFGGTLVNDFVDSSDQEPERSRERSLQVSIPTVSYALNMATEDTSTFSIEASPSVVAIADRTSRFFEGANVLIVPSGDETEPVERDIGIELKVTPTEITDSHVGLSVQIELSNLTASTVGGGGAQLLQTEKTTAEAFARVPFGRAMALGSGAKMTTRSGDGGVTALRDAPAIGRLFGNASAAAARNDVLVLVTARRDRQDRVGVDEQALSMRLFGFAPAAVSRVSRLPSETPALDVADWF